MGGPIVVTGGAGFIGSNLVHALNRQGDVVVVCDWMDRDKAANLEGANFEWVDPENLLDWLEHRGGVVQAIVHLGAVTDTSISDLRYLKRVNVRPSIELWRWCARHQKKFVYASSAAVYGQAAGPGHTASNVRGLRPLNAYGRAKLVVDRVISADATAGRAPPTWAGLRFFNVLGPHEFHKGAMASIVLAMFRAATRGDPIRLFKSTDERFNDGEQERDFIHVDDCVSIILWALQNNTREIFDVGTGSSTTFLEMSDAVFASTGFRSAIEFIEMPATFRGRYQNHTKASMDRVRELGWQGKPMSPTASVQAYWDWLSVRRADLLAWSARS